MKHPTSRFLVLITMAAMLVVAGCSSKPKKKDYDTTIARFFIETMEADAFASVTLPVSGVQIAIKNKPIITEYDYTAVQLAQSDLGKFLIFNLTGAASRDVYRLTGANQGKRLVLFINDVPVGARVIDRAFETGAISVFAAIPEDELTEVAKNLNRTSIDIQEEVRKAK